MAKVTLTDLTTLTNQTSAVSTINANNTAIETALENTLSRDGTTPNAMESDLDMNDYRILNLPEPLDPTEPLRLQDVNLTVNGALYLKGTSNTSVTVGTGTKSFTTQSGRLFETGTYVTIVDLDTLTSTMSGKVSSYSGSALTVSVTNSSGSGTYGNWAIYVAGAPGAGGGGGGGSLTDADYGDITVSGVGTVMTIDNNVVNNSKAADMAANSIKGNNTGSSADPKDLTVAEVKTLLAYTTGDIGAQPVDSTLTAVAAYNTNGLFTQTAADTFVGRTITGPASGISVTNGDGVSGNPTIALTDDLSALEALSSTGIAVRSAADTWVQRTVTGTANQVTVTNGDGVSGNPTLSLPSLVVVPSVVQVPQNGLQLRDTNNTNNLGINVGSDLTIDRTLTIVTGDSNRTLTMTGDATIVNSNTGDQTITLTSDVTGSGTGSITATIANNAVTNDKAADMATARIKGRVTASTGDPEDLTGAQATSILSQFNSTDQGVVPGSGGGTSNFLRADGSWAVPAGGGGSSTLDAPPIIDKVKETTTTTGTGDLTLSGAVSNFQTFNTKFGTNIWFEYMIIGATTEWETGSGYLSGSTTLVRARPLDGSAGAFTLVNFSAGTKDVFFTINKRTIKRPLAYNATSRRLWRF